MIQKVTKTYCIFTSVTKTDEKVTKNRQKNRLKMIPKFGMIKIATETIVDRKPTGNITETN